MIITEEKKLEFDFYNIDIYKSFRKEIDFFTEIGEEFDIEEILSKHYLLDWEKEYDLNLSNLLMLDEDKYLKLVKKHNILFDSFDHAKINRVVYKALLKKEKNETIISNLKTFRFDKLGYAEKVKYGRNENVSGRLIVKNGPNILTLPSRCRSIFESRFDSGEVLSIDFTSLEPRLCLKICDIKDPEDVYQEVMKKVSFETDRSVIKRAVISVLYGMKSIKGFSDERSKEIVSVIYEYFNLEKILEISRNINQNGIRRNFLGRPLWNINEDKPHILVNNYIQSSAVDLALTYFSELVSKLDLQRAVPLYMIHDSLVFDVEKEFKSKFVNIVKKGYNHELLGHFPLKIENFNRS